jgi:hypothetical protein
VLGSILSKHFTTISLEYPPGAAALVIAAIPCFLQPVSGKFAKAGRGWDEASTLTISLDRWLLEDCDHHVLARFNPVERLADLLLLSRLI